MSKNHMTKFYFFAVARSYIISAFHSKNSKALGMQMARKSIEYVGPTCCLAEMYAGRVACESRGLCAARFTKVRKKTGQTDRQTDGRTSDRYLTVTA